MKRIVQISPAFDRRDPDPKKNYGIHGCDLRMVLKGRAGAVQFVLYTNWHLPHVQDEMDKKIYGEFPHLSCHPLPADLGYHSPKPMYEGQRDMGPCEYLSGRKCYYDGSSLSAERIYQVLLERGSEAVWAELEQYYRDTFLVKSEDKP